MWLRLISAARRGVSWGRLSLETAQLIFAFSEPLSRYTTCRLAYLAIGLVGSQVNLAATSNNLAFLCINAPAIQKIEGCLIKCSILEVFLIFIDTIALSKNTVGTGYVRLNERG